MTTQPRPKNLEDLTFFLSANKNKHPEKEKVSQFVPPPGWITPGLPDPSSVGIRGTDISLSGDERYHSNENDGNGAGWDNNLRDK